MNHGTHLFPRDDLVDVATLSEIDVVRACQLTQRERLLKPTELEVHVWQILKVHKRRIDNRRTADHVENCVVINVTEQSTARTQANTAKVKTIGRRRGVAIICRDRRKREIVVDKAIIGVHTTGQADRVGTVAAGPREVVAERTVQAGGQLALGLVTHDLGLEVAVGTGSLASFLLHFLVFVIREHALGMQLLEQGLHIGGGGRAEGRQNGGQGGNGTHRRKALGVELGHFVSPWKDGGVHQLDVSLGRGWQAKMTKRLPKAKSAPF